MEKRPFGKTGLSVSALGFGAAELGYAGAEGSLFKEVLFGALDAGLNTIDTAECYGTSEERLGEVLGKRRKDLLLFTKCGHANGYADPDWNDVGRLEKSLERSLKRLRTDAVDLFQLHSCSKEALERGEVVEFMKRAKKAGKTRFIGYSGDDEAALFAVKSGVFDALQTSVNLADQDVLGEILPEAKKRGMGVIAKRPIGNAAWRHSDRPSEYHAPYWERFKKLKYDFLEKPEAAETALRFTLSSPGVCTAIVGTTKPGRWQENAKSVAKGPLDKKAYDAIRRRWEETAEANWIGQI